MPINCIVNEATNELESWTRTDNYIIKAGRKLVVIPDNEVIPGGIWDTITTRWVSYITRTLSVAAFKRRFTFAELAGLESAARQDNATGNRVAAWLRFVSDNGRIDLDEAWLNTTVNQMETAGLIGAGRADEILANG